MYHNIMTDEQYAAALNKFEQGSNEHAVLMMCPPGSAIETPSLFEISPIEGFEEFIGETSITPLPAEPD